MAHFSAGTRETAFLSVLISAGIAIEVVRKCKEQNLDSCSCSFPMLPLNVGADTVIAGCGDNCDYGAKVAEAFTDCGKAKDCGQANDSCTGLAAVHNYKVGREVRLCIKFATWF